MLLNGLHADAKIIGDLLVEAPGDHPVHDIALPGGQAVKTALDVRQPDLFVAPPGRHLNGLLDAIKEVLLIEGLLQEIEGAKGTVRAECCDGCKSYLKIVAQDKDPHVDPVADDLATLALDMLADEAGYERAGPNLLLMGAYGG